MKSRVIIMVMLTMRVIIIDTAQLGLQSRLRGYSTIRITVRLKVMSVTRDTSHDPMGPFGRLGH